MEVFIVVVKAFRANTFSEVHFYHSFAELKETISDTNFDRLFEWYKNHCVGHLELVDIHGKPSCLVIKKDVVY